MNDPIPACVGQQSLMWSTNPKDHEYAKAEFCDHCGFIEKCREMRDTRDPGGGLPFLTGTWAGELWVNGRRADGAPDEREASTRRCQIESCGRPLEKSGPVRAWYCSDGCREVARRRTQAKYDQKRQATS